MSMFGQIGRTNYLAPNYGQGSDTQGIIDAVSGARKAEQDRNFEMQQDMMRMQRQNQLQDLALSRPAPQNPTMGGDRYNVFGTGTSGGGNTIFKDYLDPYKMAQLTQGNRRLDIAAANNEAKNNIAQQRADTAADVAGKPYLVQMKTSGGDVYYMDRRTGQIVNTGVASGTMTDADKASQKAQQAYDLEGYKQAGKLELEDERQPNRMELVGERGKQARQNIAAQGEQSRFTKATPSGTPVQPSQERIAVQNRMNVIMNRHPELRSFMSYDPNSQQVTVTPVGQKNWLGNQTGPTQEQYDMIMNQLYPQGQPTAQPVQPSALDNTGAGGNTIIQRSKTDPSKIRISNDGGKTWQMVGGNQ